MWFPSSIHKLQDRRDPNNIGSSAEGCLFAVFIHYFKTDDMNSELNTPHINVKDNVPSLEVTLDASTSLINSPFLSCQSTVTIKVPIITDAESLGVLPKFMH
jgi:hypothetical protein